MKTKRGGKEDVPEWASRVEEPVAELARPAPLPSSVRVNQEAMSAAPSVRATVNVRTAKDQLSSLLERASEGEEIVVTSDGRPKGMIVRFRPQAEGRVAESMADLRRAMAQTADSTALIRAERDAGF